MSFQEVFDYVQQTFPQIAIQPNRTLQAVQVINEWLAAGCDATLDIIPVLEGMKQQKGHILALSYFTKPVMQHKEDRTKGFEHQKKIAEAHAWTRDRYPAQFDADIYAKTFLNEFEQKYGRVYVKPRNTSHPNSLQQT